MVTVRHAAFALEVPQVLAVRARPKASASGSFSCPSGPYAGRRFRPTMGRKPMCSCDGRGSPMTGERTGRPVVPPARDGVLDPDAVLRRRLRGGRGVLPARRWMPGHEVGDTAQLGQLTTGEEELVRLGLLPGARRADPSVSPSRSCRWVQLLGSFSGYEPGPTVRKGVRVPLHHTLTCDDAEFGSEAVT